MSHTSLHQTEQYWCLSSQVIRKGEVSCCWICTACKDNEYVQDEFTCKACELGWWPDEELQGTTAFFILNQVYY